MKSLTEHKAKKVSPSVLRAEALLKGEPVLYARIAHYKNCGDFRSYEHCKRVLYGFKDLDYSRWVDVIIGFLNV